MVFMMLEMADYCSKMQMLNKLAFIHAMLEY